MARGGSSGHSPQFQGSSDCLPPQQTHGSKFRACNFGNPFTENCREVTVHEPYLHVEELRIINAMPDSAQKVAIALLDLRYLCNDFLRDWR